MGFILTGKTSSKTVEYAQNKEKSCVSTQSFQQITFGICAENEQSKVSKETHIPKNHPNARSNQHFLTGLGFFN